MAYGKMNTFIDVITTEPTKDAEGFVTKGDHVLASVRAYKEVRNTTARWERIIGNAAFSSVTAMFRFRKIPGLDVNVRHFISDGENRYNIVSAEDVRGRGMYVEVLAEKLEGTVM
jgi:head-tail adaptor